MRDVDDCRKKASDYPLAAHLTACLAMFLFKAGSRNQYNQHREDIQFQKNYKRSFGFAMLHGDSVNNVMNLLDTAQIEQLKQKMVKVLLQNKTFHNSRYRGHWFRIAVDASGLGSYAHQRDEQCLHRTSKTGNMAWSINTLGGYTALKNYFQFMQMAHIIHQLMTLNTRFQESFMMGKNHPILKNLGPDLIAAMKWVNVDEQELERINHTRRQFRFAVR